MKKFILSLAALAMLFTACQKDEPQAGAEVEVNFTLEAPQAMSRALAADGTNSALGGLSNVDYTKYDLRYILAIYQNDVLVKDTYVETLDGAGAIAFNVRLSPGTYNVVAWADFVTQGSKENLHYNIPFVNDDRYDLTNITLNEVAINQESRDAYFANEVVEIAGTVQKSIILRRPFGKLRVVATDIAELNDGVVPTSVDVTYKAEIASGFNAYSGEITGTRTATFTGAAVLDYKEGYDTAATTHQTLMVDYILATATPTPIHFTMSTKDGNNNVIRTYDFSTDIPVERNALTTVIGNVLTHGNFITVEVDPNFDEEKAHNVLIWDGKPASIDDLPAANEEGVVEITTPNELAAFAAWINAGSPAISRSNAPTDFVLTNDFDLAGYEWTPIGNEEYTFEGTFDGNGHTIKNLYIKKENPAYYMGFFGTVENATIKNVTFDGVDVFVASDDSNEGGHIAAVAGYAKNTTFENILVKGDVKVESTFEKNAASRVAVIAGGNYSGLVTMKNVKVEANEGSYVKANSSVGALAGQLQEEANFENCSSNIEVIGSKFFAGGIIGLAPQKATFKNCSTFANVSVLAGREGNDNDLFRVGAIAGGWGDNGANVLTLTGCSYTGKLTGKSADGRTAEAFDCGGFVGRGYAAKVGAKVSVDGKVYEYKGDGIYTCDGILVVSTGDALVAALGQNENVVFGGDIKINPANMSNAYGKTGVLVYNGQTIDGAGHKLDVKGAGGTWDSGICTSGGLIKNLWVTGSFRGIFVKGADHIEKVVLENVRIEGTTYTISIDQASGQGLEATNSIFRGWTSYAKTIGNVKFDGCTFGAGNGYNFSRPYAPTEYVNCTFEAGHAIDPRAAVTFENCTFDGVALTAENLATLVASNIANASVK